MAWLVGGGALGGRAFDVRGACRIGRGAENEVVLDDPRVSRRHARVTREPEGFVLYDLESENGTFVGDERVTRHCLAPGDRVRVGGAELVFLDHDAEPTVADDEATEPAARFASTPPDPPRALDAADAARRLERDLDLAARAQRSFLPRALPCVPGVELESEYRPAFAVGGDFYDAFLLAPHRLGLVIGDVAGKGVAAALWMAPVSRELRAALLAGLGPAAALARVNRALLEAAAPDLFGTAVALELDARTGRVVIANAGHVPPFVRRAHGAVVERLDAGGTALGILDDAGVCDTALRLGAGDAIVLCTDGVSEAVDPRGAQFGLDRLARSLAAARTARAPDLAARLAHDLREHVRGAAPADDLTVLVCAVTQRAADRLATPVHPAPSSRAPAPLGPDR
jgi:hypothetical protein